jgi:hypothetical protein
MKFAFALIVALFVAPKPVTELPPEPAEACVYPDIMPHCPLSDSGPVCVEDDSTNPCTFFCYCP